MPERVTVEDILLLLLDAKSVIEGKCLDEDKASKVLAQIDTVLDTEDLECLIEDHVSSLMRRVDRLSLANDEASQEELDMLLDVIRRENANLVKTRTLLYGI